jgi:hypothetical protein
MTTPNFKLLLHALRLGQPPEPTSAIRALAEELAAQEEQFEELKKKLAVLGSHLQFVEARAARLENAPPAYEGYAHEGYASAPSPASARAADPRAAGPRSAPPNSASAALEAYEASLAALAPHATSAVASESASPTSLHRHRSVPPPARPPLETEDSSDDEYRSETVVVNRRDIDALRGQEAPFRLPPPGSRGVPEARRSIPGAPWARGGRPGQGSAGQVQDDHTVDMPGGREEPDDPDDTFRERGGYAGERGVPGSDEPPPRRR